MERKVTEEPCETVGSFLHWKLTGMAGGKGKLALAELQKTVVVEDMLAVPSEGAMREYYGNVGAAGVGEGLEVRYIGRGMGKGVFAGRDFGEDEVVLKEPQLVGAQSTRSKMHSLNCSFCFRYIGSLELQVGRRLKLIAEGGEDAHRHDGDDGYGSDRSMGEHALGEEYDLGFVEVGEEAARKLRERESLAEGLLNGAIQLPYSSLFPLPPVEKCSGGCGEEYYCSLSCAEGAWEGYHSLLCTGPGSFCRDRKALAWFQQHADTTNDAFRIAAQVIAKTMLRFRRIKQVNRDMTDEAALLEAWKPFAMGWKGLMWETVARPEDVDSDDETEFRDSIKTMAADSLHLLTQAIFSPEFEPLFTLEVYGNIMGMFELNNLEIVVSNPLEDYFIHIDELPQREKEQAEKLTRPLLEAFGDDYGVYCEGSGFFRLQSCMNHSCDPNARAFKRSEDIDGQAVLLANRVITKGEQITISYVDVNLPFEDRKQALADYGFECHCEICAARE